MPRLKGTCCACRNAIPYEGRTLADHGVNGLPRHNSIDAPPRCAGSYKDSVENLNAPRVKLTRVEQIRAERIRRKVS